MSRLLIAIISLFIAMPVSAQVVVSDPPASTPMPAPADTEVSFLSYGKIASGYLFGDQRFVVSPNAVFQTGTTASRKDGWYGDLWLSQDLADRSFSKGRASEIDVTAGWSGECGSMTCNLQAAYYIEPALFSFKNDIMRLRLELKRVYAFGKDTAVSWYIGNDYFAFLNGPDTDVMRGGVTMTESFSSDWSATIRLGVGYDVRPHNANGNYEIDIDRTLGNGWAVGPYAEGYLPLNHGGKSFSVWGLRFSKAW